VDLIKN